MTDKWQCLFPGCTDEVHVAGLCKTHYDEDNLKGQKRVDAMEALRTFNIGGKLPTKKELKNELFRLHKWWYHACYAMKNMEDHESVPYSEAEAAMDWCISLAQEIIDAEMAHREGKTPNDSLLETRQKVWKRFENLKAGLQSNGSPKE